MLILAKNQRAFEVRIGGLALTVRRLESWQWARVEARAGAAARTLRDGGTVLERYGFDAAEFDTLKDPAAWKGIAEYLYAVELGIEAIGAWQGVWTDEDPPRPADISAGAIATLMRVKPVMDQFLLRMREEGGVFLEEVAEGERLRQLAEWEFSGGSDHCETCRRLETPCSKGLPGPNGELCPSREHEPRTVEGRAAARIARVAGVWRYAGMAGTLVGLDWPAARLQMPVHGTGVAWRRVAVLLAMFERGALKGAAKRVKSKDRADED